MGGKDTQDEVAAATEKGTSEKAASPCDVSQGGAETKAPASDTPGFIPPTREDGSPWPEVDGKKPGDPYYGVMLEQMEWGQRKRRRYSFVLAIQIAFFVAVAGIIIYFAVTS